MKVLHAIAVITISVFWLAGCTTMNSLHYNWAYTPLHDAKSAAFEPPAGELSTASLTASRPWPRPSGTCTARVT